MINRYLVTIDGKTFVRSALPAVVLSDGHGWMGIAAVAADGDGYDGLRYNPHHGSDGRFTGGGGGGGAAPSSTNKGPQGMGGAKTFSTDSEAVGYAKDKWGKAQITDGEADTLRRYQGAGYQGTNPYLRGKQFPPKRAAEIEADMKVLDGALAKHKVPEDMVVWRGVNGSAFPGGLSEKLAGTVIKEKAYLSTAVGAKVPSAFADKQVQMRIRVPAGTPAYFMPGVAKDARMRSERELMLGRGQKMLVHSMKYNGRSGKWQADVEIVQ